MRTSITLSSSLIVGTSCYSLDEHLVALAQLSSHTFIEEGCALRCNEDAQNVATSHEKMLYDSTPALGKNDVIVTSDDSGMRSFDQVHIASTHLINR